MANIERQEFELSERVHKFRFGEWVLESMM